MSDTPPQDPPQDPPPHNDPPPANPPTDNPPPPAPPSREGTVEERLDKITDVLTGIVATLANREDPDKSPVKEPWTKRWSW